jgi:hypothetical protein
MHASGDTTPGWCDSQAEFISTCWTMASIENGRKNESGRRHRDDGDGGRCDGTRCDKGRG